MTGLHNAVGITYRPPSTSRPFDSPPVTPPSSPNSFQSTFSAAVTDRALSVIFSPHGCSYKSIEPYASQHLVSEAALPLTALLHGFDRVTNPWWLGGNICAGFPGGLDIAQNLLAKAWISAHDGNKDTSGFAAKRIVVQQFKREEIEDIVSPRSDKFPSRRIGTVAVVLAVGEEMCLNQIMSFGTDSDSDRTLSHPGNILNSMVLGTTFE